MGLRLVHDDPNADVAVFYMDIQSFGKDFDRYRREARARLRLVRGLPGDFYAADGDRISVTYFDEAEGRTRTEEFDMVVLSIGLMPAPGNVFFKESLGLPLDADGFLSSPVAPAEDGLVLAGTAGGPMDVAESIAGAKAAAWRLGRHLSGAPAIREYDQPRVSPGDDRVQSHPD
jgi:heterodisulfide reductase subunit A